MNHSPESPAQRGFHFPKYRFSSPANALPCRASSRAISCTVSWMASRFRTSTHLCGGSFGLFVSYTKV